MLRRLTFLLGIQVLAMSALAGDLFPLYEQYQRAIAAGDAAAARRFLSEGRLKHFASMNDEKALSEMNVLSPKEELKARDEILDGDDGTLVVTAKVEDNQPTGRIQFVREHNRWKILSEMWEFGGDEEAPTEVRQPENDQQRDALRKLRELGYPEPTADFLVMSAVEGKLEAVKLFLAAGYSPDTAVDGAPAIVRAAMFGHPDVVMTLLEAGANVNAVDEVNTTALMRMAEKCDATDTIRALLRGGAKTDVKSAGGADAAQLAGWAGCKDNAKAIAGASK
jgi:ankyrin repeat protein